MKYPNAYKGIGKVFAAEILTIIGTVVTLIGFVLTIAGAVVTTELAYAGDLVSDDVTGAAGTAVIGAVLTLVGAVIMIIAYIMNLVGLSQGGKDEPLFKLAFLVSIAMLIITIIGAIVGSVTGNNTMSNTVETISSIANLAIMLMVVEGLRKFARELNNATVEGLGQTVEVLITIMLLASIVLRFFVTAAPTVAVVLSVVSSIAAIVAYICYLVFLAKGKSMLRNN